MIFDHAQQEMGIAVLAGNRKPLYRNNSDAVTGRFNCVGAGLNFAIFRQELLVMTLNQFSGLFGEEIMRRLFDDFGSREAVKHLRGPIDEDILQIARSLGNNRLGYVFDDRR